MITAGIDCGSQNTKGVLLKDGKVIARGKSATEFDANNTAQRLYEALLEDAGIRMDEVEKIVATGTGRDIIEFANTTINEVGSAARGARFMKPDTYLVIDMGAESSRVIRLTEDGTVKKYETNDKCASGAGTFIETMARALQIEAEEMGAYSLRHTKEIVTNAQCVVFAESEVISLIHQQESKEDIAYGIHVGICNRVASLVRRVGLTDNVTLIGGPGNNEGLVQCMEKVFGRDIFVPEDTDYVSAIGAALYATENV
ncbi:BadF/BadG/BcrA/BcrD ATPase family protein [Clostridium sediminicola]|uniref:acyl-CoA dehydratase activase n=1 Tax=Clostridium sediminicola TaxID=3114879 RepID=UPI0031F1EC03